MIYYKYDASGNTFIIFYTDVKKNFSELAVELCSKERYNCDGMIVVIPNSQYDFEWLFYNNDGTEASMCGNGTRAVAHFAVKHKYAKEKMSFLTGAGVIHCQVKGDVVETQMGPYKELLKPFIEENLDCWFVDTGVPHIVILTSNVANFDREVCKRFRQKYNANVNYMSVDEDRNIFVRTFERGVEGETLACGTGMVACFLRAYFLNIVGTQARVYPTSKEELLLRFEENTIYFKGKVKEGF